MDLDEIDVVLPKWRQDIDAAGKNLSDLEASPGYKLTRQFLSKMQGKSATKVAEAFKGFDAIWVHFSLLKDVIRRAEDLRKNMPAIFGKGDVIRQIVELLSGPSVILQTKEIPLAERSLTGATQKKETTTPRDIFSKMQKEFESVCKASALYEKSYVDLTDKLGKALEECEKSNDAEKRAKLEAVSPLIDSDPISGLEQFDAATKPPKKLVKRLENGRFAPVAPSEEPKKKEPEKTMGPAPQDQPKAEPKKASPEISRVLDDARVKRSVGTEKLDTLEKLILTKKSPTPAHVPSSPINLPTPTKQIPPAKSLEDLISKRKKGKL